jgi:hypothetical protein
MATTNSGGVATNKDKAGAAADEALVRAVPAELRDGRIAFAGSDAQFGEMLEGRSLVIFRNVFATEDMLELRRLVRSWGDATPAFPNDRSAGIPGLNFHRIDDSSHRTTLAHIFHQYGFGTLAALEAPLRPLLGRVSEALIDLQNRLAGTALRAAPDSLRIKIIRHPRGGGMIAPHTHPYLPQKVAVFLNMSVPGIDYDSADTRFKLAGRWISTRKVFGCGDVLAWRYDAVHDIPPVDAGEPLSWDGDDGLWILAPELVESHGHSKVVGDTAASSAPR